MADPTSRAAPAGWYADPYGGDARRWWDGARWTEHLAYPAPHQPWRDPRPLVPFLVTGLVFSALARIGTLAAHRHQLGVANALRAGERGLAVLDRARASDRQVAEATVLSTAVLVATAVLWLVWFSRAYHDAAMLRRVRHRGLTVWGWLIPFVSLVVPKRMMNDAWMAGDREYDIYTATPPGLPRVLLLWWLTFVAAGSLAFSANGLGNSRGGAPRAEDLVYATQFAIAADALLVVDAVLAIVVVRDVTRRLDARGRAEGRA